MKAPRYVLLAALSLLGLTTNAQDFPEGNTPLTEDALGSSISGKVFAVKPSQGAVWRWQFDADGYFFINIGSFSDRGKWTVKESTLCTEGGRIKYSCNEIRSVAGTLYMRRDSGEIVKLELR